MNQQVPALVICIKQTIVELNTLTTLQQDNNKNELILNRKRVEHKSADRIKQLSPSNNYDEMAENAMYTINSQGFSATSQTSLSQTKNLNLTSLATSSSSSFWQAPKNTVQIDKLSILPALYTTTLEIAKEAIRTAGKNKKGSCTVDDVIVAFRKIAGNEISDAAIKNQFHQLYLKTSRESSSSNSSSSSTSSNSRTYDEKRLGPYMRHIATVNNLGVDIMNSDNKSNNKAENSSEFFSSL